MNLNIITKPQHSTTNHKNVNLLTDSNQTYCRFEVASKQLRSTFVLKRNDNEAAKKLSRMNHNFGLTYVLKSFFMKSGGNPSSGQVMKGYTRCGFIEINDFLSALA